LLNGLTDCRVKPGNDGGEVERAQRLAPCGVNDTQRETS